jgi:glycosyltransferase involved in cell wall biosynthesis
LHPNATFTIIGPDNGELNSLRDLCGLLGVEKSVVFFGPASHEEIVNCASRASFYLQTSRYEGMAMSVVEAMQLGLLPVSTPAGEVASYCKDGVNAVIIDADSKAVEDILYLMSNDSIYYEIRKNAIATWRDIPLYSESVISTCQGFATSI